MAIQWGRPLARTGIEAAGTDQRVALIPWAALGTGWLQKIRGGWNLGVHLSVYVDGEGALWKVGGS